MPSDPSPKAVDFVATNQAPQAIGPYSQAVRAGGFLFVSGQIALDPKTGTLDDANIEAETERVLRNLDAILDAAGVHRSQVAKATIYLTDLGHFQTVNEIYGEFFGAHKPARATVQVAALPKGARIEIDLTCVVGG
jgi:2-iminobutanoate/2-iminopropanoate deaminase